MSRAFSTGAPLQDQYPDTALLSQVKHEANRTIRRTSSVRPDSDPGKASGQEGAQEASKMGGSQSQGAVRIRKHQGLRVPKVANETDARIALQQQPRSSQVVKRRPVLDEVDDWPNSPAEQSLPPGGVFKPRPIPKSEPDAYAKETDSSATSPKRSTARVPPVPDSAKDQAQTQSAGKPSHIRQVAIAPAPWQTQTQPDFQPRWQSQPQPRSQSQSKPQAQAQPALTHLNSKGQAHMVRLPTTDIKPATSRMATAMSIVVFSNPHAYRLITESQSQSQLQSQFLPPDLASAVRGFLDGKKSIKDLEAIVSSTSSNQIGQEQSQAQSQEPEKEIAPPRKSKGDILATARIAGIQAAKSTSALIPLCHNIALSGVAVNIEIRAPDPERRHMYGALAISASASCNGQTGVEMEAMTAASVAALTVYDMCKAVDRGMRIEGVRVVKKTGGRSGDWKIEGGEEGELINEGVAVGAGAEEKPKESKPEGQFFRKHDRYGS